MLVIESPMIPGRKRGRIGGGLFRVGVRDEDFAAGNQDVRVHLRIRRFDLRQFDLHAFVAVGFDDEAEIVALLDHIFVSLRGDAGGGGGFIRGG